MLKQPMGAQYTVPKLAKKFKRQFKKIPILNKSLTPVYFLDSTKQFKKFGNAQKPACRFL